MTFSKWMVCAATHNIRALLVFALVVFLPLVAGAGTPGALSTAGDAVVASVVDGDTVVLDDGRQVRLVGIQAPKLALGRAGFEDWPLASESKAHLEALSLGKRVTLRLPTTAADRHGRVLAHLVTVAGIWLQGEMLSSGMARVYTFNDNRLLAAEMLDREAAARNRAAGLWGLEFYKLRTPWTVRHDINTFQVIEGRVVDVATVGKWTYINFGKNWRTDFTARFDRKAAKLFDHAGLDAPALKGQRVRVRGWVHQRNGAMVDITHPEQVEVLSQ